MASPDTRPTWGDLSHDHHRPPLRAGFVGTTTLRPHDKRASYDAFGLTFWVRVDAVGDEPRWVLTIWVPGMQDHVRLVFSRTDSPDGGQRQVEVGVVIQSGPEGSWVVGRFAVGAWIEVAAVVCPEEGCSTKESYVVFLCVAGYWKRIVSLRRYCWAHAIDRVELQACRGDAHVVEYHTVMACVARIALYLRRARDLLAPAAARGAPWSLLLPAIDIEPDAYYPLDDPWCVRQRDVLGACQDVKIRGFWSAPLGDDPSGYYDASPPLQCLPLLQDDPWADVRLVAGDEPEASPVMAHRAILVRECSYLDAVFRGGSTGAFARPPEDRVHGDGGAAVRVVTVVVPDCRREVLEALVRALYGAGLHYGDGGVDDSAFRPWMVTDRAARLHLPCYPAAGWTAMVAGLVELACVADMVGATRVANACVSALIKKVWVNYDTAAGVSLRASCTAEALLLLPRVDNCLAPVRREYLQRLADHRGFLDAACLARLEVTGLLAEVDQAAHPPFDPVLADCAGVVTSAAPKQ